MIRRQTLLWMFLAAMTGVMTYVVKQCVLAVEKDLRRAESDVYRLQESLHILRAEWAYLNDPVRLQQLVESHLNHGSPTLYQLADLQDLPDRTDTPIPSIKDDSSLHLASARGVF